MWRWRGGVVAGAVVVLVLVVAVLQPPPAAARVPDHRLPPFAGGPNRPVVIGIGDSLLRSLERPLTPTARVGGFTRHLVDDGWRVSVRAENGWRTAKVRGLARTAATRGPTAVVVSSGANDVRWARNQPDIQAARAVVVRQIRRLLLEVRGAACVVWPTVTPVGDQRNRRSYQTVNTTLREQAALDPRVLVPEWGRRAGRHPRWFAGDRVHFTPAGATAFEATIREALRSCPGAPGTTEPPPSG